VVSHISRKTREMWGTQWSVVWGNKNKSSYCLCGKAQANITPPLLVKMYWRPPSW